MQEGDLKEEFDEQWLLDIPINGTICPGEDVNQPQDRNATAIREAIKSFFVWNKLYNIFLDVITTQGEVRISSDWYDQLGDKNQSPKTSKKKSYEN